MMSEKLCAAEVVQLQLDAYNGRDISTYAALFAPDACVSAIGDGKIFARDCREIREFYAARFASSPELHCELVSRIALGPWVVDHERVTGIGTSLVEIIAIYEVRDGLIRNVRFLSGDRDIPVPTSLGEPDDRKD
jgi:hypothetical protein